MEIRGNGFQAPVISGLWTGLGFVQEVKLRAPLDKWGATNVDNAM